MINYINLTPGSACLAPANAPTPEFYYLSYGVGAYYGCTWSGYLPTNFKDKQSVSLKAYYQGQPLNSGVTVAELNVIIYDANGVMLTPITLVTNNLDLVDPNLIYTTTFELSSYFTTNASWYVLGLIRDTTFYAADVFPGAVRFLDAVIIPSSV